MITVLYLYVTYTLIMSDPQSSGAAITDWARGGLHLVVTCGDIVKCLGLLFTDLAHVKSTMTRSANTVVSEPTAAASSSPGRKRACLLFAHYGTRPAVHG